MRTPFKTTLAALAVSSLSLSAAATVTTFATTDAVFAKSDKSNSRSSEGRGYSSEARGKSGSKGKSTHSTRAHGKSGAQSKNSVESFFAKFTGKDNRPANLERNAKSAKNDEATFHPSELGNMNGALNANVNAVLAHIRNGNGNGPVGHIAVLAAASASADGAQDVLDRAALFDAIQSSEYDSLEEYYQALEGVPGNPVDSDIEGADDKDLAAIDAGFASYDDYLSQLAVPPAEPDEDIDQALSKLGVDVIERGDAPADLALDSSDPLVIDAQNNLASEKEAEDGILAYWNKNPGGDVDPETGRTEAESQLLTELRERFTEEEKTAIQETVLAVSTDSDEGVDGCDADEELCLPDDEVVLVIE